MKVHLPQPSNPERESRKFGSMMESDRKLPLLRVRDVYFDLRHPLNGGDFISLIGNQCSSCRIRLEDDSTVSNAHLEVRYTTQPRPSVWVIDLNSGHGTRVSGQRIEAGADIELREGDRLTIGTSNDHISFQWFNPVSKNQIVENDLGESGKKEDLTAVIHTRDGLIGPVIENYIGPENVSSVSGIKQPPHNPVFKNQIVENDLGESGKKEDLTVVIHTQDGLIGPVIENYIGPENVSSVSGIKQPPHNPVFKNQMIENDLSESSKKEDWTAVIHTQDGLIGPVIENYIEPKNVSSVSGIKQPVNAPATVLTPAEDLGQIKPIE